MNWVFWFFIIVVLFLIWFGLVLIFRPLGKGINFFKNGIDEVINGNDEDNILDKKEN